MAVALLDGEVDHLREPAAVLRAAGAMQEAGRGAEEVERPRVAAEDSRYEADLVLAAALGAVRGEELAVQRAVIVRQIRRGAEPGFEVSTLASPIEYVAGFQPDRREVGADDFRKAGAGEQHVEADDPFGSGHDGAGDLRHRELPRRTAGELMSK